MLFTLMSAYGVFLLAVISPGPDFVITVQSCLRHGVRAGIWTALVSTVVFSGTYAFRVAEEARQLADALQATELVLPPW